MIFVRSIIFLGLIVWGTNARAHDPGLSSANLTRFPDRIELVTTFSVDDARLLLAVSEHAESTPIRSELISRELTQLAPSLWHLQSGETQLVAQSMTVAMTGNNVICTQYYLSSSGEILRFSSEIFDLLPPGHRQYASVFNAEGSVVLGQLLSQAEPGFSVILPPPLVGHTDTAHSIGDSVSFVQFFHLGIEHIITGYDHLLFLFAFLITAQGIRTVLKIVTSFTVAHSLTLSLSALNIVTVPAQWVEPLIAASVVFVALQNIFQREQTSERVGMTFAFGLIHGFGFASILRDMGISSLGTSAWRALAGFNTGVELGQITVASIVFPLLWHLRSRPSYNTAWAPAASSLIALTGGYWLAVRLHWL